MRARDIIINVFFMVVDYVVKKIDAVFNCGKKDRCSFQLSEKLRKILSNRIEAMRIKENGKELEKT
jgi:hypothetical protein